MSAKGQIIFESRTVLDWDEYTDTVTIRNPTAQVDMNYSEARDLRAALDFLFADRYPR